MGGRLLRHFAKRYRLVVLLGLVSVLALVLVGRWLNATKRGGQGPAEPFRIAGNWYYVGATEPTLTLPRRNSAADDCTKLTIKDYQYGRKQDQAHRR